jgi:predicted peptidase
MSVEPQKAGSEATADQVLDQFEAREVRFSGGEYHDEPFGYRLLTPSRVEPGHQYPLLLFLHGADQRGHDNRSQIKFLPAWMAAPEMRLRYPCYLIAPQCRTDKRWVEVGRALDRAAPREPPGPQSQVVLKILEAVIRECAVDEQRLYLTGLSMGGYGSWDLGTRLAERWAAVAPICGGGDELYADRLAGVPVWAWHGDADDVVPVAKTRRMIAAIRQAGGDPKYTELAGVGHDSWTAAYQRADGLLPWIFAQANH